MQFDVGYRRRKTQAVVSDDLSDIYPSDVQMYLIPPGNEITLTEFEDLALDRLQALRIIEQASLKGHKHFSKDWIDCIKSDLKKENLNKFLRLINANSGQTEADFQARRADHVSHFILRLAYCRSAELRRWFLAREKDFFWLRFSHLSSENVKKFLEFNNLVYTPISSEEKGDIRTLLIESTAVFSDAMVEKSDFYKVAVSEVGSLVAKRKVYINKGFAYVPGSELVTCILSIFRSQLNEALANMNRKLPSLDDDRLNGLLNNIHTSYIGNDYSTVQSNANSIDIAMLDHYSSTNYPLCMRHIHEVFRSTHTLKHGCRMQYGLFIKGIGVTYEDAMSFWREEFTKQIDGNEFEKKYAYTFSHQYGKVGSQIDYSPYSCIKIIMNNVGAGEHHGCPFRHWDSTLLKQKLNEYGLSATGIKEILDLVQKENYQIACGKYFEVTQGTSSKKVINHPNQYFEESVDIENKLVSISSAKKAKISIVPSKIDEIFNEEQ